MSITGETMSKRPHSPKGRHDQQPLKRCSSGCDIAASVEEASNDINLPQQLCDDSLLHVLSYADTSSLVHFTRGTSNAIRDRFHSALENRIWKDAFHNHHLAPLHLAENSDPPEYFSALRRRLALFSNLRGKPTRRNKQLKHSYNLPSRFFHFVPILPNDLMHFPPSGHEDSNANDISLQVVNSYQDEAVNHVDLDHDDDIDQSAYQLNVDPPPVEFSCDSYSLTSPGTGEELVFLNPFSGTVEVRNVLDNAVGNDESILEHAMLKASDSISVDVRKQHEHENSGIIVEEAFHQSSMYDTPPKQVLYSVDDYFDLDLNEYFGAHTPFQHRRSSGNVTSDWVGVDSHSAPLGTVIGAARILTMESEEGEEVCTEVFAWSNFDRETGELIMKENDSSKYCCKHVVRAAGSFYFLDVCANKFKVFAVFQAGSCPFDAIAQHDTAQRGRARNNLILEEINDNDSVVNEDGGTIRMSRTIFCLPLVECDDAKPTPDSIQLKFPKPDAAIKAQYPVASFSIDTTGEHLVVGSINGTVEIWDTSLSDKPRRSQLLSVRQCFIKRHRAMTLDERKTSKNDELSNSIDKPSDNEQDAATSNIEFSILDDTALLSIGEDFPHKHPTSKISQIYLPRHLPVQKCGFVTKQRSAEFGTTLLLWQTPTIFLEEADKSCSHFQITAMINVPILAQCHPEVHFDGRRLLVFGKDHIGLIVLVYHVLGTRFDQDGFIDFEKTKFNAKGEESGGVLNLIDERRVKFVNRIRHSGLDGLEYFDSMLMTANERYLVINTKAGHLIGCDGRNASEGLLVIDLEDTRDDNTTIENAIDYNN